MRLFDLFLVMLGGSLGAAFRYVLTLFLGAVSYPLATLLVNFIGSFLLIALALKSVLLVQWIHAFSGDSSLLSFLDSKNVQLFLGTGMCGAMTTYSTFNKESIFLLEQGAYLKAFMYMLLTMVLCLAAGFFALFLFGEQQSS